SDDTAFARGQIACETLPVRVSELRRDDELSEFATYCIGLRVAKHSFGRGIELRHSSFRVHRDDAVKRHVHDRTMTRFALSKSVECPRAFHDPRLQSLVRILDLLGHRVESSAKGSDFVTAVREHPPRVITGR